MIRSAALAAIITTTALAAGAVAAQSASQPPAATQPTAAPASQWRAVTHATGTGYETGTFDQPVDGGVRIACLADGSATLTTQIKGVAPAPGSRFLLIPATRGGRTQTFAFTAGPEGRVDFARASTDRRLGQLWTALRGGNNATVRYGDGTFAVQSLAGTRETLPARPCGRG